LLSIFCGTLYHLDVSHGDIWTLAAVVAIEELGGPKIAWRPGRKDANSGHECPPDHRLPEPAKVQQTKDLTSCITEIKETTAALRKAPFFVLLKS
jgi:catalase (peroxidase I)